MVTTGDGLVSLPSPLSAVFYKEHKPRVTFLANQKETWTCEEESGQSPGDLNKATELKTEVVSCILYGFQHYYHPGSTF